MLLAIAFIALGVVLRVALVGAGWPGTDSDDSTMGLMARHILYHGELPLFFWGQAYMGTIEAYLGALMFALFGPSLFALKLGLIALYAAFMAIMYPLLVRLFDRRWALVGLGLLALGTSDMLYHELNAYGGYLETIFFGALMTLITVWLIGVSGDVSRLRQRAWAFVTWGLAAGLGLWSDPLVAPFVALTGLALLLVFRRAALGRLALLAALGLAVGILPWLLYLLRAPSLDVAKSFLQHAPQTRVAAAAPESSLGQRIAGHVAGTIVIAVPNNTGEMGFCPLARETAWPPDQWTTPGVRACIAIRSVWGAGFLGALAAALALEVGALRKLPRTSAANWSAEERRRAARCLGRLVALGAPALTVVFFAFSSASAGSPWIFSRYLISLLIALPVVPATLWEHAPAPRMRWARKPVIAGGTAVIALGLLIGAATTFRLAGPQQAQTQQDTDLGHVLIARGDTRVYSEFWTCFRTAFLTNERVVCSTVNGQFEPQPNRYPPYDGLVRSAPRLAFVFPLHSAQSDDFPALAAQHGWRYSSIPVDGQWLIFEVQTSGARL